MPHCPRTLIASAALIGLTMAAAQAAGPSPIQAVTKLWSFNHGSPALGFGSEIAAWDATTNQIFVVGGRHIDVLSLAGNRVASFDASGFGAVNSIAIFNGTAAVSFSNGMVQNPGSVQFFSTAGLAAGSGAHLGGVTVGAVPDMVTWAANGTRLLVANEGERQSNAINPAGSISLIGYNAATPGASTVSTLGFTAWDGQEAALRAGGVRIQAGVATSVALEPEYIALSGNGQRAMVTLQENNAVAIIDLAAATPAVTQIVGLGTKTYNTSANSIDPSDRDNQTLLRNVPVKGLYMPDAVAGYQAGGKTFYVMANEGDAFTDDSDVARLGNTRADTAITLNPALYPDAAALKANANLGRLNVLLNGATGDGSKDNMTEIVSMGGRSFSIRDDSGTLVYDSGNLIEQAAIAANLYDDGRSDDKGVEPEGVALFSLAGRQIAAIGLERTTRSAVALFDVTDPTAVSFLQMIDGGDTNEIRAEGLLAFSSGGKHYLLVANEGNPDIAGANGFSAMYQITAVPEPGTYALMLAGLAGVLALSRRRAGR